MWTPTTVGPLLLSFGVSLLSTYHYYSNLRTSTYPPRVLSTKLWNFCTKFVNGKKIQANFKVKSCTKPPPQSRPGRLLYQTFGSTLQEAPDYQRYNKRLPSLCKGYIGLGNPGFQVKWCKARKLLPALEALPKALARDQAPDHPHQQEGRGVHQVFPQKDHAGRLCPQERD